MGRPPKNSGAKVTSQVIDEVDKNINVNLEATVDVEKEQLKAQLAEQQQKMDELMAQMKLMMQAQANISACCLGRKHRAYGYIWRYSDDPNNLEVKPLTPYRSPIN